ncbi:MAG TPA: PsbP-related protein [bacterium]|nr:PsbP-related protein [bacterium]
MNAHDRKKSPGIALALTVAMLIAAAGVSAAPVPMQRYEDPEKTFSIDYPKGWTAARLANGATAFYLDDPAEGTAFLVLPNVELKGVHTAGVLWGDFAADLHRRAPDWTQTSLKETSGEAGQRSVEVRYTWTNVRKVKMTGWLLLATQPAPSQDRTYAGMVSYQAPSAQFASWEPMFRRMLSSLSFDR